MDIAIGHSPDLVRERATCQFNYKHMTCQEVKAIKNKERSRAIFFSNQLLLNKNPTIIQFLLFQRSAKDLQLADMFWKQETD